MYQLDIYMLAHTHMDTHLHPNHLQYLADHSFHSCVTCFNLTLPPALLSFKCMHAQGGTLSRLHSSKDRADEDALDATEAFERMQLTALSASDPDSAAYHAARKHTSTLRSSTQFKGVKAAASNARRKEQEQLINAGLKA